MWDQLTNNSRGSSSIITVAQGRNMTIPKAAKNVAEVDFYDMCDDAKGSTDYMALAQSFNTIIIRKVP
jgi:cell division protein ZapE